MRDTMRLLLGITDESRDVLLQYYVDKACALISDYIKRDKAYCEAFLSTVIIDLAVVFYNRQGTEGLSSQSYSGVSESYLNTIPEHIRVQLSAHRHFRREARNDSPADADGEAL